MGSTDLNSRERVDFTVSSRSAESSFLNKHNTALRFAMFSSGSGNVFREGEHVSETLSNQGRRLVSRLCISVMLMKQDMKRVHHESEG